MDLSITIQEGFLLGQMVKIIDWCWLVQRKIKLTFPQDGKKWEQHVRGGHGSQLPTGLTATHWSDNYPLVWQLPTGLITTHWSDNYLWSDNYPLVWQLPTALVSQWPTDMTTDKTTAYMQIFTKSCDTFNLLHITFIYNIYIFFTKTRKKI